MPAPHAGWLGLAAASVVAAAGALGWVAGRAGQEPYLAGCAIDPAAVAADRPDEPAAVRQPGELATVGGVAMVTRRGATRPVAERDQVAALLLREQARPGTLVALAPGLLHGKGDRAQKAALLVALARSGGRGTASALALGVAPHNAIEDEHGESLPRLAVRLLGERSQRDPEARAALAGIAFRRDVAEAVRCRAIAFAADAGDERERCILLTQARTAGDDALVQALLDLPRDGTR